MRNKHGLEVRHVVALDDRGEVELHRYHGTPREQIQIDGSFTPLEWERLCEALDQWAKDPEEFWLPSQEERP